jgi:hypothetical protein
MKFRIPEPHNFGSKSGTCELLTGLRIGWRLSLSEVFAMSCHPASPITMPNLHSRPWLNLFQNGAQEAGMKFPVAGLICPASHGLLLIRVLVTFARILQIVLETVVQGLVFSTVGNKQAGLIGLIGLIVFTQASQSSLERSKLQANQAQKSSLIGKFNRLDSILT